LCTTKNLPFDCVCPQCLRDRKHFEQYLEEF
jgi:rubredoxin